MFHESFSTHRSCVNIQSALRSKKSPKVLHNHLTLFSHSARADTGTLTVPDGFTNLAEHTRPGDLIVFNDTKVIPARLTGLRHREESEVRVEATLLKRVASDRWQALAKPGKRLRVGDRIEFGVLVAEVAEKGEGYP